MTHAEPAPTKQFTVRKASILGGVCLVVGIAGGWSVHNVQKAAGMQPAANETAAAGGAPVATVAGPAELRQMADAQAAPLLDRLKADPTNAGNLASLGNLYYDAQQYSVAIDYYARALAGSPSNAAVRTDMATAYWYSGDANRAIAEFNKALSYEPDNPNTLFNLGLVRWKARRDGAGALGDWQKLLATHPDYEGRDKVVAMMTEIKDSQR